MRTKAFALLTVILSGILLFSGCTHYKITQRLEQPIKKPSNCSIGEIEDKLPTDFDEDDKPALEHIEKFRDYLKTELEKKDIFQTVQLMNLELEYEVVGGILDFKKGSGFVRFLIGFGAGSAKLTIELKLKDRNTGEILFAGNFKQEVSSYLESGDMIFKRIAQDFAKELEKQIKKLQKGN